MARDVVELEALLRGHRADVTVDDVLVIDDRDVPRIAHAIDGKLEQMSVAEAVISSINFYSAPRRVAADHPGAAALIAEVDAWVQRGAAGRDPEAHRPAALAAIRSIFEAIYGTAHGDAWIDVDTTDFMLDPAGYLETVADHFGIAMPPYGTNREVVAYVLARWPD